MKKEFMLTHFLFFSLIRLSQRFLLLLSLATAIGLDVVSAQSSSGITVPPLRQQRSWIVGRNANVKSGQAENETTTSTSSAAGKVLPGCTDFCLNAINPVYGKTLVGLSAQMYPCQDSDNSLFQYNNSSRAITIWDPVHSVNRCLDAGEFPPPPTGSSDTKGFTIQRCKANATNQQWYLQAGGQVRSGVVNSSSNSNSTASDSLSPPQSLFMYGNGRRPEDWGKGWNSFDLYLSSEGNFDSGNPTSTFSSFSWITYVSPASAASQLAASPQISNLSANWVMNGGFERFAYDPGQTGRSDFNSSIWWFTICSWTINSGSVQLVNRSIWETDRNDRFGNTTLHLNGYEGPGAITQLISLESGSNYSLTFDIAGDPTVACGPSLKTMIALISPSNVPQTFVSFIVSGKSPQSLGWTSIQQLNFTAFGSSVNFTFQSTTDGSCGPLMDNVVLRMFRDSPISAPSSHGLNRSALKLAVKVMIPVCAAGLLLFMVLCCWWCTSRQKHHDHVSRRFFVKGIRCSSDSNAMESAFKNRSLSFSGMSESRYSWEELQTATANFSKRLDSDADKEGSGVHDGFLYLGEFRDGLYGIVKVDHFQRGLWPSDEAFKHEVALLHRIHHSYLVNLVGVCTGEAAMQRALIFEYIPNGNLFDRLHKAHDKEPLSWQARMVIAYQVACALEYLHEELSPPVVHRDVQASNVLLQRDDSAKLAIFDVSNLKSAAGPGPRQCIIPINSPNGVNNSVNKDNAATAAEGVQRTSSGHLDPAYRRTGRMSKKTDVYYYGALLLELITGVPLAAGSTEISSKPISRGGETVATQSATAHGHGQWHEEEELQANITDVVDPKLLGKFNRNELVEVFDIATKCLRPEGKSRPSMSDVVFMLRVGFASSRPLLAP